MAAKKAALHLVGGDEPAEDQAPPKRERMTVSQAIEDGDELDLKLAERRIVASRLDNERTPARDIAALTKRMSEIQNEIKVLEAAATAKQERDAGSKQAADDSFDASAI